ncbi:MAG TPA: hypothetical protein VMU98_02015 [Acidimicrobiales bacterium]|nr:hypothetical protein [Acidimicrobiales bacterium]
MKWTRASFWRTRARGGPPRLFFNGIIVAALFLAMTVPATPSSSASVSPPYQQPSLFSVGLARCTFIDHTRSVSNFIITPPSVLSNSRTLVTEIRYPTPLVVGGAGEVPSAPPARRGGGYPMIVFAHGYDVMPDTYAALLDSWTRAGFVVVAPIFPDENASEVAAQRGFNTEGDLSNEPADLAFVTKQVLEAAAGTLGSCPIVRSLIEASEVAFAGHSDGATAVGMLAYDHGVDPQGLNFATLRHGINVRAVVILEGAENSAQSYATEASHPALLVVQSVADRCNPFRNGVKIYDAMHQTNKWFLELQKAHHLPPFNGTDATAFKLVAATSILFLQTSLAPATSSPTLIDFANQRPAIARMFTQERVPKPARTPPLIQYCGPN